MGIASRAIVTEVMTTVERRKIPVHVSGEYPTDLSCLQEKRKRLHDPSRHGKCAEAFAKQADTDAASRKST